jgi:hypothetical protein
MVPAPTGSQKLLHWRLRKMIERLFPIAHWVCKINIGHTEGALQQGRVLK